MVDDINILTFIKLEDSCDVQVVDHFSSIGYVASAAGYYRHHRYRYAGTIYRWYSEYLRVSSMFCYINKRKCISGCSRMFRITFQDDFSIDYVMLLRLI